MGSFVSNFKKQNMKEGFLSPSILDELNSKWNGNFAYHYFENEGYLLLPNNNKFEFKMKNFKVKNKEEIEAKCGKENMTFNEILEYSYNAQKPIYLKPLENFQQFINDTLIDRNEMVIPESGELNFKNGEIIIAPPKMNINFVLKVGSLNNFYEFEFERKTTEHLMKKKFSTKDDSWIHIEYETNNEKVNFNFIIDKNNISTPKQYLAGLKFMQDIYNEGMYINGHKISEPLKDDKYESRSQLITLWQEIVEIEDFLNLNFKINKDEFSKEELIDIYTLHQTLIEHKPVKKFEKLNTASYEYNEQNEILFNKFNPDSYKNLYIEFYDEIEFDVLSTKINLYFIKGYFNLNVNKVEKNDEKQEYILYFDEDKDNKMFNSLMVFDSYDKLNEFVHEKDHIDWLYKNSTQLFEKSEV